MIYRRAYVLLSGGIDSSTCLYMADKEFKGEIVAISVDYGQRHKKEIDAAKTISEKLVFKHKTLKLEGVIPTSRLTDETSEIPSISYSEIKGVSPMYVPFRNGFMISALASYVQGQFQQSLNKDKNDWAIYFGAHAEDAAGWAYPDCTPEFIGAMANAVYVGTYHKVRLFTPLQWMNKADIIRKGTELNVPWDLTWSCYAGGPQHCGICPTCRARRQGFIAAGVNDPTPYAATP